MKWIGLTGGLASGKSTVARMLRERGYPVIDADEISRQVVARGTVGLSKILSQFGADLMLPSGELDRRGLGRKVFGDQTARLQLEAIIHPLVQNEVARLRTDYMKQGHRLAFYDVPLLFEKNIPGFDATIVVSAPADLQRTRMRGRDGLSEDEITARLASQLPMSEKEKKATHVLINSSTLENLEKALEDLLPKL